MKRRIGAFMLLAVLAAAAAAAPVETPAADTSTDTHKTPAAATTSAATAKSSTKDVVLQKGAKKPQTATQAVKRAIEVFVPSQKIDVDKAVDFPTNI